MGKIAELAEDAVNAAKRGGVKSVDDDEGIKRRFHLMVISGRLRVEVCWVTNRSGSGMINREDLNTKNGRPVFKVVKDKHPECMITEIGKEGWTSFEP